MKSINFWRAHDLKFFQIFEHAGIAGQFSEKDLLAHYVRLLPKTQNREINTGFALKISCLGRVGDASLTPRQARLYTVIVTVKLAVTAIKNGGGELGGILGTSKFFKTCSSNDQVRLKLSFAFFFICFFAEKHPSYYVENSCFSLSILKYA